MDGPVQRRSPAHPVDQRPHRDSRDRRRDAVGDAAVHERRAVHDFQQQHRRRSERRADRSVAGRHLQRHAPSRSDADVENKGGRNGAIGPDYFQVDVRAGWRAASGRRTGRSSCSSTSSTSPTARTSTTRRATSGSRRRSCVLTNLRGGGGFPRQAQLGVRYVLIVRWRRAGVGGPAPSLS